MSRMLAALAFSALAVYAQDATGAIEGVITDSATKLPVLGAQISVTPEETAADVFTDASGSFRFAGLAPDRYGIRAKRDGYREAFRFVDVKNGASAEQIAMKMTPFSDIAGQVLDEDGHPMQGVEIYSANLHHVTTDAEGRYQLIELVPGNYRLVCRLPFDMREKLIEHNEQTGDVRGYADTYYFPGVEDPERAANTKVAAGVHIGGFDFRLKRGPLVEFSGRVVDINREPLTVAAVELASQNTRLSDEAKQRRRVKPDGSFRFELIPPGQYTLLVYRDGAVNMAARAYRMPVDMGAGGWKDAELRIPRNVDLAVTLTAPHPERMQGAFGVRLIRSDGIGSPQTFSRRDACLVGNPCAQTDVPPGQWTFDVQAFGLTETGESPRRLYVESMRFGQQDAWNLPVSVAEGGNPPIEILVTDQAGTISASVSTEDGQPADTAYVDVWRTDGGRGPVQRLQRTPTGKFVIDGLVPGEYQVAAFVPRDDEDGIRTVPVDRCGDRALKVTITAGQTANVTLKPCMPD